MAHIFKLLQFMFQLGVYFDPRVSYDPYETGVTNVKKYACSGKFQYDFEKCNLRIPLDLDDALQTCDIQGGYVPEFDLDEIEEYFESITDETLIYKAKNTTLEPRCIRECETMVSDYENLFIMKDKGARGVCPCPLDLLNDDINVLCRTDLGFPCEYLGRDTDLTPRSAKPKLREFSDSDHISLMPNIDWRFGDFACAWRVKQTVMERGSSRGLMIKITIVVDVKTRNRLEKDFCFGSLTIKDSRTDAVLYNNKCIRDKLQVVEKIAPVGIYYKTDDIQNRAQTYTLFTEGSDVVIQYAVRNNEIGTIGLHINTTERIKEKNIPRVYVATEERLPRDFTWNMAREFCQNKSPNGSLCRLKDACRYGSWMHLNESTEHHIRPTRFIPLNNGLNRWAEYSPYSACDYSPRIMDPRVPPIWGFEQGNCPKDNCNIKKYIYCCDYVEKPVRRSPPEVIITQQSIDMYHEVYVYKYVPRRFTRYTPMVMATRPTYNNWKYFARLPGDVGMFTLKDGYSEQFPTPVYICKRRHFSHRAQLSDEVYIIALKCEDPYYDLYQFYTSLEPINDTIAVYVGASSTAGLLRTRVSVGGFCCGYDEPKHSFVMYVTTSSIAEEIPPQQGAGQKIIREPDATNSLPISSVSSQTQDSFIFIVGAERKGIKFTPTGLIDVGHSLETDKECFFSPAAIEISNPVTHRVYAIYCGRHAGPHDTIYSDSNVLQIRLMCSRNYDKSKVQFEFKHEGIQFTIPRPVYQPNRNTTWLGAQQACKNRGLDLCRKSEVCAGNLHKSFLGRENRRGAIVPVLDYHLGVVEVEYTSCAFKDGDDITARYQYSTLCCNYTINTQLPNWPIEKQPAEPLVVQQVKFKNHKAKGFAFIVNGTELATFTTWRNLTLTKLTNNTSMVSTFTLSKHYTEVFNQVVYICYDDKLRFRIQLERCILSERFKLFRGYAATHNTPDSSLTKIYIARSRKRSSRVTLKRSNSYFKQDPFTLYVIGAEEFK